jgi:hypothetical protein
MANDNLIGIGLYTPADASRLLGVPAPKIIRWLRGYNKGDHEYQPLWKSQVELDDGHVYLGFRDLMEARIANKFISLGISAQRVRAAIQLASDIIGDTRPLSTNQFRTDGRSIFLRSIETNELGHEREQLLNLFKRQYEFAQIIEPLLKGIDFDDTGAPSTWWPVGKIKKILIDPKRSFGQPIDSDSSVPTAILAAAGRYQGVGNAAKVYGVSQSSITRAMDFETKMEFSAAA